MANFQGKFNSTRQDWPTPDKLFDVLDRRYGFNFDLAADKSNTKCVNYFTKEDDALLQIWKGVCWLNPPYGGSGTNKLKAWVMKAFKAGQIDGCSVTMLIPARTNTNWWHDYCMRAKEILFIRGRPKFGDAKHGLPQPLAIVYFDNTKNKPSYYSINLKTGQII
jgi:phage N-6-adenine-methyltransferase